MIVWHSYKVEYDAIKLSFSFISPGSFVLVGRSGEGTDLEDLTDSPILHAPTLAVHYASAFVPSFYAMPGMQPMRVWPALKQLTIIDTFHLAPVQLSVLKAIAGGRISSATPRHVRYWPHEFDFLYLVGSRIANPLPDLLLELVASERFVLYQVRK